MTTYGPPGDGPIAPARPWLGWLLAVVAISAGVLVTLGTLLLHFIGCVDGDGGVPYTAEDSPKAAVCSAAGGTTPLLIPMAGVLAAALLVWVCRRWHQGRSRTRWLAVALLVPAAFPFAVVVALNLPSASCTGETRLAYAAWVDEGAIGQPPHECAKY